MPADLGHQQEAKRWAIPQRGTVDTRIVRVPQVIKVKPSVASACPLHLPEELWTTNSMVLPIAGYPKDLPFTVGMLHEAPREQTHVGHGMHLASFRTGILGNHKMISVEHKTAHQHLQKMGLKVSKHQLWGDHGNLREAFKVEELKAPGRLPKVYNLETTADHGKQTAGVQIHGVAGDKMTGRLHRGSGARLRAMTGLKLRITSLERATWS